MNNHQPKTPHLRRQIRKTLKKALALRPVPPKTTRIRVSNISLIRTGAHWLYGVARDLRRPYMPAQLKATIKVVSLNMPRYP